jgi:putative endonuclease
MYFVYVLQSKKNKKLYYGLTKDLENRLEEHNKGSVPSTKSRLPFDLVYFEKVDTVSEARKKERYFKSGFGRKYIKGKLTH